jgi:transposase
MGRVAKPVVLNREEREEPKAITSSGTHEARLVQRAKIVLLCSEGAAISKIAEKLDIRPNTVLAWRDRYREEGLEGLYDRERSGRPVTYGEVFRNEVLQLLQTPPPDGLACWDGPRIAAHLKTSKDAVWRLLRQEVSVQAASAVGV